VTHSPDLTTTDPALSGYLHGLTSEDGPGLLGHLAIYTVADVDPVTQDALRNWFDELELDDRHLPGPPRADAAFEKATSAAKARYPLGTRTRAHGRSGQTVSLMMRNIVRDETRIVRHLVRELADHDHEELSYEVRLATATFTRLGGPSVADGDGTMTLTLEQDELDALGETESTAVADLIAAVQADYDNRLRHVGADRLRGMLRDYIEGPLGAVRVHPGVYFVHHRHTATLARLRTLAARFGVDLTRVPLPNVAEMRTMVDTAFDAKAQADLESLARDIARAVTDPKGHQVRKIHARYLAVKAAAADYQATLDTHLVATEATLALVEAQMASLLVAAGQAGDGPTTDTADGPDAARPGESDTATG
jgi:hypothetical protein